MGKGGRTMRKRRAFAVLLACSLLLSGNSMTVLAAETGVDQPVAATQTEAPETSENTGETGEPGTAQEPGESETPGAAQEPGKSETPGTSQQPGETQAPEESGTPEEAEKPDESETPEDTEKPGESGTPEDGETPEETEDPDVPKADEAEKEPAEDEEAEPVKEQEEPEQAASAVQNYVSRIVTFTDDTGMQVTYDANASTRYRYVVENGVLTAVMISTTVSGNTTEEPAKFTGNVELRQPEEGEKYTSIAASVFSENQEITYVKLPAGLETVGAGAFKGCTALKGLYLPAGVTKIENSAFENCTAMTQINIPKTVSVIGDSAFKGDIRLYLVFMKDVDYSELKSIGAEAFSGCTVLSQLCSHSDFIFPIKLETIGASAFRDCKAIKKVDFSANKNLAAIGAHAFAGCGGLTDLSPGKTLSEIPEGAFSGCNGLVNINFVNGKNMAIGREAFKGCYSLKELTLPQSINRIDEYAFLGCTKLKQVKIDCYNIEIALQAFPADAADLVIVAEEDSNGYVYALRNGIKVPQENAFYRYTVENVDGVLMPIDQDSNKKPLEGIYKFPGGTLWVETETLTGAENNVNTQNNGKGVKSGEVCYIYYTQTPEETKSHTFIASSLRCNGKTMEKKEGKYFFEMPIGGAVITAEFRANTPDNIKGQKVTVEFSNGTPMQDGATDEYGYVGIELKVGQTCRMFLLDEDGNPISAKAAKLSVVGTNSQNVAKVDKNGVITAVGTGGKAKASAVVRAELKGADGYPITINRTVSVKMAEARKIILKASDYDNHFVDITGNTDGIQTASISKTFVLSREQKFKLKANVYDDEEGISRELTWTTSNAKVARLKSDKTAAADPVNEIVVPAGCEGEATITVTAKNSADSEKEKVTQKFVVRVYEPGFRLVRSEITVNPRMEEGAFIELISAYGIGLENAQIKLYEQNTMGTTGDFITTYDELASSDTCKRFRVRPIAGTLENGTYKVRVGVNDVMTNLLPLTIKVKETKPGPTIKFNANKAKFNLFYQNGGVTAEGDPISVVTEITKLGDVKLKKAVLEPLTQKADDRLFTENFVIDDDGTDLAKGKIAIKRSAGTLRYTTQKKPAVKGYLVLYFAGYDDSAAKKVTVTMPTCTTAPSWALRTAKGTYRADVGPQNISFELFDKKSKTKEQVMLDQSYTVTPEGVNEVVPGEEQPSIENGFIKMNFVPGQGSIRLTLKNPAWDLDQNGKERTLTFTYNVAVSNNKPVIKPDQNTVTLNLNYPEKTAQFKLVSNLGGVEINEAQTFEPKITNANADQIQNLKVTYENGVGTVSIESGKTVKKGNYKFECFPNGDTELKKAVLTVKVADVKPGVKFGKGSLQLNGVVYANNKAANDANADLSTSVLEDDVEEYREVSQRPFKVSGVPEGYQLAPVGSGDDKTSVVGAMPTRPDIEKYFDFAVEEDPLHEKDDVLKVSLKETLAKGTYKFKLTPRYVKEGMRIVSAQTVDFQVKVLNESNIFLNVTAKGKVNLVNREGEANDKNGILYTPVLKNIVGEIEDVKIWDGGTLKESKYFDISLIKEGKDAGKFFVTPKKPVLTEKPDGSAEYTYPPLENNKPYQVRIWVKVKGYAGKADTTDGGVLSKSVQIKAAQVLPKVTLSRSSMDVFLSTKDYNADFVVKPKEGTVGTIEEIYFDEKDELARDSFELIQTPQADGSMKVTVHLKEAVGFANGTVNNVKFYVKYKGQGTNTPEKATGFTMKIKVN